MSEPGITLHEDFQPETRKLPLLKRGDWWVLEIRGERDVPGYVPEDVGRGMSQSTFRREVLGDWTASSGKVVYPEYGPKMHRALERLPFNPHRPLICGWDLPGANGGTPAFVPTQVNVLGQWLIYPELVPPKDETVGMYEFGERVAQYLYEEFAKPANLKLQDLLLEHYGDPAGNQKPPRTGGTSSARLEMRSAYEILQRGQQIVVGYDDREEPIIEERPGWGWTIRDGAVSLTERIEAVRSRLTTVLRDGLPALVVDPNATMICDGFGGGYNFKQRANGVYDHDPDKNEYSHCMDALSYPASRLFAARGAPKADEDEWVPDHVRHGAAGGYGRRRSRSR